MVNYSCESLYPKYTKQLNGVKYSCEALEAVPGEEGMAGALLKKFLGIPSGDFEYVLITLPEKYKEKLLGQVFCRPAPGYEMPSVPTVFNVDNSKIIPQWPTTKTHDKATGVQIERGLSYDDVVAKWTKFADFMVGISKIDEDADAGTEIDKLFSRIFSSGELGSSGLVFKTAVNRWPTDKWFTDTNYSIVRKLESQASRITAAAKVILDKSFNFETKPEKLELSSWKITKKWGLLHTLTSIYKHSNTKCYNFAAQLYKLNKRLTKI